jgi:phage protein D
VPQVTAKILIDSVEALDVLASLIEMVIEEDQHLASVFRLKLAIALGTDGKWSLLDDERIKVWKPLAFKVQLGDTEVELIDGFITQLNPHVVTDLNSCCLEIVGMDGSCLMSVEEKIKAWPGKTDSDIAREVFQTYSLTPQVDDVDVGHEEAVSTILQRDTDIRFLKRLARRNGFECFVKGGTGYFQNPVLDGDPLPVLAAQFGQDTNLMTFRGNLNALRPTSVEMQQYDIATKEVQSATTDTGEQRQLGRDAAIDTATPTSGSPKLFVRHAVTTSQAEMENLCRAIFHEAEWLIEGRGEVDTVAYGSVLQARQLVPIRGVGETFSGVYYLSSVKHVFTANSYVQHFTAKRNALAPTGPADFSAGGLLAGVL